MNYISPQEMREHFEKIEVKRREVNTIATPLFLPEFAEALTAILHAHGILVEQKQDYCLVHFPKGTYKTENLPRTLHERYTIIVSDGFEIQEINRRNEACSYLRIAESQLDPHEQEILKGK